MARVLIFRAFALNNFINVYFILYNNSNFITILIVRKIIDNGGWIIGSIGFNFIVVNDVVQSEAGDS